MKSLIKKYTQISDADFDENIKKSKELVILIFFAEWSGTSQMFINALNTISNEGEYTFNFFTVDIEKSPHQAALWNIRNVPTTYILNKGEIVDRFTGILSKNRVRMKLSSILSSGEFGVAAE